eukprot:5196050-Pyramimonas_sp.AAC.1
MWVAWRRASERGLTTAARSASSAPSAPACTNSPGNSHQASSQCVISTGGAAKRERRTFHLLA